MVGRVRALVSIAHKQDIFAAVCSNNPCSISLFTTYTISCRCKSYYQVHVTSTAIGRCWKTWPKMNYVFIFAAFIKVTLLRFLFVCIYALVYVRLKRQCPCICAHVTAASAIARYTPTGLPKLFAARPFCATRLSVLPLHHFGRNVEAGEMNPFAKGVVYFFFS